MPIHKDQIPPFIPKGKCQLIILGTMGSINARTIDGDRPSGEYFYYNNSRNHFWKVLQRLLRPKREPKKFNLREKKAFLDEYSIAILNIVDEAIVSKKSIHDPSDTVLFDSHKKNKITFKKLSPRMRKLIKTRPMFFTCRSKKGIRDLLVDFFEFNNLPPDHIEKVWFWATPTRCNPEARANLWRSEMKDFLKRLEQ